LINGLFDCQRSRVPVLAIAAHIPIAEIGSTYFQETHPQHLFAECSHFVELVSAPEQLPRVLARAMRVAIAHSGVAVVVVPGELLLRPIDAAVPSWIAPRPPLVRPDDTDLDALAALLNGAKRVTMLCGAGCAGAREAVVATARLLQAPVVHALRGKEHVEAENPFDVGMTGLLGMTSGYHAMCDCEVLLMLGTDFPYRQFYPPQARIAQVDIRPENLGNRCALALGVVGDVGATLAALQPRLQAKSDSAHLDGALADFRKTRQELDALAQAKPGDKKIHPQYVTSVVSRVCAGDAIFSCDVGTPTAWAARYLRMTPQRRLLGSFNHGSMANALPQAIGAQAACPGRQVIALSGDGGFSMMMGDFLTLTQMHLPVKVVVLNNGTLGFVELEMKANGLLDTAVALQNPNFAAMAQAIGVFGVRVEAPEMLEEALTAALAHDGPALVDVVSARQELLMPPQTTLAQTEHFGLFALKAVLDGRMGELVDLARTNIR
jgi:pyruvate dehydrogenase (quinone)